jgi:hypothetical protein
MQTMNSIAAHEHAGDLRERADRSRTAPRTQVRRWVQLKHMYGNREERWAAPARRRSADPACATC